MGPVTVSAVFTFLHNPRVGVSTYQFEKFWSRRLTPENGVV